MTTSKLLDALITELTRLPGIGMKSAERLAYHLLMTEKGEALALADAIRELKGKLRSCRRCHNIAAEELCEVCRDPKRETTLLCVVEQPRDLQVIEASGAYRGLYHVLGGSYAPLERRDEGSLTLRQLKSRIQKEGIEEVIIATNPDFEGDGTALVIAEFLKGESVQVSQIARGIPSGSHLENMNRSIIADSLSGRRVYRSPPPEDSGRESAES